MNNQFATLALLTGLLSMTLAAAPITISEPPDFPAAGGPTYVLDVGTNTISGSVNGCSGCTGTDYQDSFTLSLPVGLQVTSGSFSAGGFTSGGGTGSQLGCFTGVGCFGTGIISGMSALPEGLSNFTATSPYSFDGLGQPLAGGYSYVLTYEVESTVPEPATGLVMLPVLAALFEVRRRRQRSASSPLCS